MKCNCSHNFLSAKVLKLSPIQYFPIHISKVIEASKLREKVMSPQSTSFNTSFMACKADTKHFIRSYLFLSYTLYFEYIQARDNEMIFIRVVL